MSKTHRMEGHAKIMGDKIKMEQIEAIMADSADEVAHHKLQTVLLIEIRDMLKAIHAATVFGSAYLVDPGERETP
jgi:hypothetical protein